MRARSSIGVSLVELLKSLGLRAARVVAPDQAVNAVGGVEEADQDRDLAHVEDAALCLGEVVEAEARWRGPSSSAFERHPSIRPEGPARPELTKGKGTRVRRRGRSGARRTPSSRRRRWWRGPRSGWAARATTCGAKSTRSRSCGGSGCVAWGKRAATKTESAQAGEGGGVERRVSGVVC